MAMVKKTIELNQSAVNRIKTALNAKTEKEAVNTVLEQFDTDIQLAELTFKDDTGDTKSERQSLRKM